MKENLVSVALRLQVAVKVAQNDEKTTVQLRRDCTEARKSAAIANKRADEATGIIQDLKIEISSLKRRIKELETQSNDPYATIPDPKSSASSTANAVADAEIDSMMFKLQHTVTFPKGTGGKPEKATPFQQWKMQQFVWTPDTPAASEYHDKHTVDMLADSVTEETLSKLKELPRYQHPSQSSVGKLRRGRVQTDSTLPSPKKVQQDAASTRLSLPTMRNIDKLCQPRPPSAGKASSARVSTAEMEDIIDTVNRMSTRKGTVFI